MAKKKTRKKTSKKMAKAARRNGKKGGRPRFTLGEDQWRAFDAMCSAGALEIDIAQVYRVDVDTINTMVKRVRGMGFSEYREQKKGLGRVLPAQIQLEMATVDKNVAMAIFLGKNWLGQSDKQQIDQRIESVNRVVYYVHNNRD